MPNQLIEQIIQKTNQSLHYIEGVDHAFDPKPLIRSFETLSDELAKTKKKLNTKIEDIEDQLIATEQSKKRGFKEFTTEYEVIILIGNQ